MAAVAGALAACTTPPYTPGADRAFEVSAAWIGDRPAVAWYGGRERREALYLRFAEASGRLSGQALELSDPSRDAFEPSLQSIAGDALVAWYEQERASRSAPARQVALLGRFDAAGRRLWLRQLSPDDRNGRIPVVRVAGEVIHVAWLEQQGGAAPRLMVAELDAEGGWRQMPRDIAAAGPETWNLNAVVDAWGVFHVLFDATTGARAKELHWASTRAGAAGDDRVSRDDGFDSAYPDVALDGLRYAVAWFDARDGNSEVYLRCGALDASGAVPADLRLDDDSARRVTRTTAASTGAYITWQQGRVVLAWLEGEGASARLWLQRFERDCRPAGRARRIGPAVSAGVPSLATSPRGVLVAWNARRGDPAAPAGDRRATSVVMLEVAPGPGLSPSAAAR